MTQSTMVWYVFYFTVLLALCVCNILIPRRMWGLLKAWRFKNPELVEPSELVVWWYRISGALGIVLIGAIAVFGFRELRGDAHCRQVLPELRERLESGGVPAVEQRARALGLEVEDPDAGRPYRRIVITDDGGPFATLYESSSDAYCDT